MGVGVNVRLRVNVQVRVNVRGVNVRIGVNVRVGADIEKVVHSPTLVGSQCKCLTETPGNQSQSR